MKNSPFSGTDWTEQWERTKRWHVLLDEVPRRAAFLGADAGLDFVYAFFLNCYHVQDWVQRSGYRSKAQLAQLFGEPEMELCRSICHSVKHFERDFGTVTSTASEQITVGWIGPVAEAKPQRQPFAGIRWVIKDEQGRSHDMFELADRCMELWTDFLRDAPL